MLNFSPSIRILLHAKPLDSDCKPIVIPIEELDTVATMIEEQEQTALANVPSEVIGDYSKEAIKALSHIDRLGMQEDAN